MICPDRILARSIPAGFSRISRSVGCGSSPRRVRGRRPTLIISPSPFCGSESDSIARYQNLSRVLGFSARLPNSRHSDTWRSHSICFRWFVFFLSSFFFFAFCVSAQLTLGASMISSFSTSAIVFSNFKTQKSKRLSQIFSCAKSCFLNHGKELGIRRLHKCFSPSYICTSIYCVQ